jgi:uncharacterized spore protein YtfJ
METQIQELLDAFADLRKRANVNAAFGKPVAAEGHTVIPVAEVTYEFEMGIEKDAPEEAAGGGGGNASVRPLAVVEVTPHSTLVKPVIDEQKLALAGGLLIGWFVFLLSRTLVKILGKQE